MRKKGTEKRRTHIELAGEGSKTGLAVDGGKDMEGELFWAFDNDMVASRVPSNHVVILLLLKQPAWHKKRRKEEPKRKSDIDIRL